MSKRTCDFAWPDFIFFFSINAACHFIPEYLEFCHVVWGGPPLPKCAGTVRCHCVSDRKNGRIERGGVIEKWAIKWQVVAGDAENEGNLNQRSELK